MKIVPTLLCKKPKEFYDYHAQLDFANWIHVDIMDGEFVRNKSVKLVDLPGLKASTKKREVHLMVKNPEYYMTAVKQAGFFRVIIHFESFKAIAKLRSVTLDYRKQGLDVLLAINPDTDLNAIEKVKGLFTGILFMGVNPGFEGQNLLPSVVDKARKLKKSSPSLLLQLDGGVNIENLIICKGLFDIVNVGSFLKKENTPLVQFKKMLEVSEGEIKRS